MWDPNGSEVGQVGPTCPDESHLGPMWASCQGSTMTLFCIDCSYSYHISFLCGLVHLLNSPLNIWYCSIAVKYSVLFQQR